MPQKKLTKLQRDLGYLEDSAPIQTKSFGILIQIGTKFVIFVTSLELKHIKQKMLS